MPETVAAGAASPGSQNTDKHKRSQCEREKAEAGASAGILDKLFGKKLLQDSRYIMSHKSWMKTVPTENCDVLMTFADTTDDHTLLWLLNHIRLGIPELILQIRHHKHTKVYAFFVTATYEGLLRGAEELGLRKTVKTEFGAGTRTFSCEEDYIYENIENELHFFTSQERQTIIKYWLENLRAKQGESLHNISFLEGQPILPELAARGIIKQIFPLHEQRILNRLMKSWVQAIFEAQPLGDICDYFGVKIAMYFAWLGYYTTSVIYPAAFGFVLWVFTESDQTSRDVSSVLFALFNVVWATLFLEGWKRRGAEFAYKWGTLDTPPEIIEEPRPQFRGQKRVSPVTGCEEFYYPPWRRRLCQCLLSVPICITCLAFVFLAMLACFELQEFVLSIKELPRLARFVPKILLAVTVTICDEVYKKIAYWLNDLENYRLQSAYEKHLIIKVVLFQFVNSYLSLFYIGFYLKDMERLKEMLATLMITRQFFQNVSEVLQPHIYERYKRGDLTVQTMWEAVVAVLKFSTQKYVNVETSAPLSAPASPAIEGNHAQPGNIDQAEAEVEGKGEKKCLNGGCGVPEEEEEEECKRKKEEEQESILDCGLKLKRVGFIEKGPKNEEQENLIEDSFLDEGSPTMVEKGMDPASVFELCEEDEEEGSKVCTEVSLDSDPIGKHPTVSLRQRTKEQEESKDEDEKRQSRASWIDPPEEDFFTPLTQAETESCMKKYEDTFQDYQEMFIQFGYVVLFSSAFPLAALCALINNVIEIRSDAFKLCTGLQRPFGQRVNNIGQWQNVMEAMGVIAIIVNCYLIGQCGQLQRLFPWLTLEMAIVSVVVLEHFALILKYMIHIVIPDIPSWVAEEMAKLEYQRREAFKKHERQAQQHYQQQQRRKREEEERQRQAEHQARKERDTGRDDSRSDSSGHEHTRDKSHSKSKGTGSTSHSSEKPKRPSSLLATNNVMKLKQIIPLQSKFLSSSAGPTNPNTMRSPQSPTTSDTKLPGFLSFKFLKSPEMKREVTTEKVQSPTKPFNPGKLFNFGKSDSPAGGPSSVGTSQSKQSSFSDSTGEKLPSKSDLNGVSEESNPDHITEANAEEEETDGHKL
ncbi:anoctamin-8 isoform X2 [Protopterus annectens]|uniref:anoctamin-8 isoform X2 n=1 Tax=Protopterus annectens TaxID=7888 RepID=UPI001CFBC002|nr:anoctamin-8 isoform X2 [Protopterus annectens]